MFVRLYLHTHTYVCYVDVPRLDQGRDEEGLDEVRFLLFAAAAAAAGDEDFSGGVAVPELCVYRERCVCEMEVCIYVYVYMCVRVHVRVR